MKEIPLLFSTPMIQSLLAGRKTMTRRIIKDEHVLYNLNVNNFIPEYYHNDKEGWCPYGQPGDLLWVRETFRKYYQVDKDGYTLFDNEILEYAADNPPLLYLMDGDGAHMYNKDGSEKYVPWKPSIFMPKVAARIWLQVESIRVERLQDITEEDAKAEGVETKETKLGPSYLDYQTGYCNGLFDAKQSFRSLWFKINGEESWYLNPFVWCVSFKVLSTTGKPKEVII